MLRVLCGTTYVQNSSFRKSLHSIVPGVLYCTVMFVQYCTVLYCDVYTILMRLPYRIYCCTVSSMCCVLLCTVLLYHTVCSNTQYVQYSMIVQYTHRYFFVQYCIQYVTSRKKFTCAIVCLLLCTAVQSTLCTVL